MLDSNTDLNHGEHGDADNNALDEENGLISLAEPTRILKQT